MLWGTQSSPTFTVFLLCDSWLHQAGIRDTQEITQEVFVLMMPQLSGAEKLMNTKMWNTVVSVDNRNKCKVLGKHRGRILGS